MNDKINDATAKMLELAKQYYNTDTLPDDFTTRLVYVPPRVDADTLAVYPLVDGRVPFIMYPQLLSKVPAGKITRWADIYAMIKKMYGVDGEKIDSLPYLDIHENLLQRWRIVGDNGAVNGCCNHNNEDRAVQREYLEEEGIPIEMRGKYACAVKDYENYLFDFNTLKVIMK